MRHLGIFTKDQRVLCVGQIGHRMQGAGTEHRFGASEFVGTVLGTGIEQPAGLQLGEKRSHGGTGQCIEGGGIADIAGHGIVAVLLLNLLDFFRNIADGLIPRQ